MSTSESTPLPGHVRDLAGQKFGRWTILSFDGLYPKSDGKNTIRWHCLCECGNARSVVQYTLLKGTSQSCGCLKDEKASMRNRTHGMSKRREYKIWKGMIKRCANPNDKWYPHYGGRGITVYQPWRESFEAFFAYIGPMPTPKHTIDRYPDNEGNYEPGNVRWATQVEQARNRSNNRTLTYHGETLTVIEWAHRLNRKPSTLYRRVYAGWSDERVIETHT